MKIAAIIASSVGLLTAIGGAGIYYKNKSEDENYKLKRYTLVDKPKILVIEPGFAGQNHHFNKAHDKLNKDEDYIMNGNEGEEKDREKQTHQVVLTNAVERVFTDGINFRDSDYLKEIENDLFEYKEVV